MNSLHINVDLDFKQLLEVVKQLSPAEKIRVNECLWDDNMEIPSAHQEIVLDRIEKNKVDSSRMLDWTKASKQLKV